VVLFGAMKQTHHLTTRIVQFQIAAVALPATTANTG
jgi:hypothetical protein